MTNREVALEYVRCFAEGDVTGLSRVLADELRFSGPLLEASSAGSYLKTLREHPLPRCGYRIESVTESDDTVVVFYDYERPSGAITIAQRFVIRDGRIVETHLVFDTADL